MNVLILGSGAREHALGWKLQSQGECRQIWIHPGNPGMKRLGFSDLGNINSLEELVVKAKQEHVGLVIIGPEQLLEQGFGNAFREAGIPVVGPNREAAQLETSKVFSKQFLLRSKIPTAASQVFYSAEELLNYPRKTWPWVLKLDGLAAGKGVVIASSEADVHSFATAIWKKQLFGPGPHQVLAEDFISGQEVSYIGLCDGQSFVPLASATDHKRVFDGNKGPNTGGMGAISPSPHLTPLLETKIHQQVIVPFLTGLKELNLDFRGVLFVGLMIDPNGNALVLEFNTRFGDPETQCVLPRLQSSLLSLLMATALGKLITVDSPKWILETSVYVVACAEGYPESPKTGAPITGLDSLSELDLLFFGGVMEKNSKLVSGGGRVLGVGALATNAAEARRKSYEALSKIHWPGIHFRKDIGA